MMPMMRRLLLPCAALLLWWPIAASADVIVAIPPSVPGQGTPLQDAIDSAAPYDTVKIAIIGGEGGSFLETVVIDKPLTLEAQCDAAPPASIYGLCNPTTLSITANDVVVRCIRVLGGSVSTVDVTGSHRVKLDRVTTAGPPRGGSFDCGTGGSGIRIANSTRVSVSRCEVPGDGWSMGPYATAGIHLVGIPPDAKVEVSKSTSNGNAVGVLVEDSNDAPRGKFGVRIKRNVIASNAIGVQLRNSDRARIEHNLVSDPDGALPMAGIALDGASDENLLIKNVVSGSVTDVIDDGSSNCWRKTKFTTGAIPPGGCP
jgi:nitrous oxidase accessory protein NosD